MKYQPVFETLISCKNADEVFRYLIDNLSESITYWDYFVDWGKVFGNIKQIEIDLNTMNYLVGKEDIESEFRMLLTRDPRLVRVIPILIASREKDIKILTAYSSGKLEYKNFRFEPRDKLTPDELEKAIEFCRETGLLGIFKDKKIKSLPDYVLGIEVGLDTNGRKNRSGKAMESIVGSLIDSFTPELAIECIPQASAKAIKEKWGIGVPIDKAERRFDFAVKSSDSLYLIETNYYGGGGSKLKATAGEYKDLFNYLSAQGLRFIWITDGLGWKSTQAKLEEAFHRIDYVLNLKMVAKGVLKQIIANNL